MSLSRWFSSCAVALILSQTGNAQEPGDPHQWLEEVTGEKPLSWVKERNAESTSELTRLPGFDAMRERILKILDSRDRIPFVSKHGEFYYNLWRDEKNPRGLWRRTTLEEYRKPEPKWETVLDLDALGREEKENWVWKGATFREPANDRCLMLLSRGGADATVVREWDVQAGAFVKDGFTLPEAKSQVGWINRDTLFVGTDFGPGSLTTSGYPRLAKEWRRGAPPASATLVFEGKPEDMMVVAYRTTEKGFEREFVARRKTFYTGEMFLRKDGRLIKVEVPDDVVAADTFREWLFVELRTPWTVGEKTYSGGALIATNFDAFMNGERKFDVLFEPTERKSLAGRAEFRGGRVILNELDNVKNRLYVLTHRDGRWEREELPGAPRIGTVNVMAVDPDESDDYFMVVEGFLTPPTLSLGTLGKAGPERLKQAPAFFNAEGLSVTQHEAVSKDGTKVPYFQVARENLDPNGKNPTILSGYGGFQISRLPAYNGAVGAAWLEQGGVYVVANIRGGGEFGPRWHQAALKANRHRAYEDFAAVADDLIRRKVTSPEHLGTVGGSNGGLLMGNMLTHYPEKFGAIVCQVPLLDMRRYNKLLAGASWMAEYGNPDVPQEWEFIKTFSPYHNVKQGAKYPRVLFTTSTRDDRVHPGHARKMVSKMREQGHDVVYYENVEGGHGGAADNKQMAFMTALAYSFFEKELK
ncbi:MAG: prolyl oligopeptidase family serine peptidase [Isosphaeraceae bacterium]